VSRGAPLSATFTMRKSVIILSCVCQIGCRSHTQTSQQAYFPPIGPVPTTTQLHNEIPRPLSDNQLRDLVSAADDLTMFGTPVPDHVLQEIKPVEIYNDLCNVVVALSRGAHEEQGYYIVTPISSYLPAGHDRGFSWERVDVSRLPDIDIYQVYVYRRTR
jgi:hypothetical protein